jgi:hypothetical protein
MRWLLKSWWFWTVTGFMLVTVCAGYLLIPVERERLTQENCDRIQLGWTPQQVVELLGPHQFVPFEALGAGEFVSLSWDDDDGNMIAVRFAHDGVFSKRFEPTKSTFHSGETLRRAPNRVALAVTCQGGELGEQSTPTRR